MLDCPLIWFKPEKSFRVSSSRIFTCLDCFWMYSKVEVSESIIFFIDTKIFWLSVKIFVMDLISFDNVFVESETDATFFSSAVGVWSFLTVFLVFDDFVVRLALLDIVS